MSLTGRLEGRSSTGNFCLKLLLVTNKYMQLILFLVTPSNDADKSRQVLWKQGLSTAIIEELLGRRFHLVSKARKNMKKNVRLTLVQCQKWQLTPLLLQLNNID